MRHRTGLTEKQCRFGASWLSSPIRLANQCETGAVGGKRGAESHRSDRKVVRNRRFDRRAVLNRSCLVEDRFCRPDESCNLTATAHP